MFELLRLGALWQVGAGRAAEEPRAAVGGAARTRQPLAPDRTG